MAITVVIPVYNYGSTLARAVRSVLPQLAADDELLIVDDGSTDTTAAVIEALEGEFPNQFRAVRKANGGAASARNLGIEMARCDWFIFLDADDEMTGDALPLIRRHLRENEHARVIIGGHWTVDEAGHKRIHLPANMPGSALDRVRGYLLDKTLSISNGASLLHREVFAAGLYPEHFRNAEDIPVFAQAMALGPVSTLSKPLAIVHKHGDSLRHDYRSSLAGGVRLVDEVFGRLPHQFQSLRASFHKQRCLSLFRSAYIAGDVSAAKQFYRQAVANDWRVLLKLSYLRKAIRLWMGRLDG